MTSTTFFMREKKPQQIGNYLLDEITPKQLKAEMDQNLVGNILFGMVFFLLLQ
jgi:hypothetical protein